MLSFISNLFVQRIHPNRSPTFLHMLPKDIFPAVFAEGSIAQWAAEKCFVQLFASQMLV